MIAFAASSAFGSAFYIWCVPMAKAMTSCCCPGEMAGHQAAAGEADHTAAITRTCCETHQIEDLV